MPHCLRPDFAAALRQTTAELGQLPAPSAAATAHSARLLDLLGQGLEATGGFLPFERFMELALYAPGLGYYSAGSTKFGEHGDFITAPELTPLFAQTLAVQCAELLRRAEADTLMEFGAGSGRMAAELLATLERLDALPTHYHIVELSADLRQRQAATLAQCVPHLTGRVTWLDRLPEAPLAAVVVANELLDAQPCARFRLAAHGVEELGVALDPQGRLCHASRPATGVLAERAERLRVRFDLPPGYSSELNLAAEGWLRAVAERLTRGALLLIDYGFPAPEYYHPQRDGGTLMCHYRHRAHPEPLLLLGLQDITAHVDFSALAEVAHTEGLQVAGFATQANFLLACGLLTLAGAAPGDERQRLATANALRRLTLPGEMGELFKVLLLTRGVEGPWCGFSLRDERARL